MISMTATYRDYFTQLLHALNAPVRDASLDALASVALYEGPNDRWNPLNSVVPHGDSTSFNDVGVQDYKTEANGIAGTAELLEGTRWAKVLAALRSKRAPTAQILAEFSRVYKSWGNTVSSWPNGTGLLDQEMGEEATPSNDATGEDESDMTEQDWGKLKDMLDNHAKFVQDVVQNNAKETIAQLTDVINSSGGKGKSKGK